MAYPTNWKRKEEESASGGKYRALDSSGNDYAGLSGMDELSQAALEAAQSSWQSANKAGDQAGMDAAHRQAESIRSKYGYSGGADGSQYLPTGSGTKQAAFSYESAPSYTSRYQNQIDELTSAILNREAFSYDPETDPLYGQYKEKYTREGQRAMQDALGEVSARTGGLASSYATTAAAQANNYYMAQLADKIPELYQLAYSMYMDEGDRLRSDLAMLQGMESGDYGRYQDRLGQYNTDRSFAYGLNRDQVADQRYAQEWNYQVGRDQRSDQRYDREYADSRSDTAWEKERYANETAYDQALAKAQTLAAGGNFSGYKALGYTDEEIASLKSAYDREQAAAAVARRSEGSGGGDTARVVDDYAGLYAAAYASPNAENYIAGHYKEYGFNSSTGLYDDYIKWRKGEADNGQRIYKNDFAALVGYVRKCIEQAGRTPEYMYDALKKQGYEDAVIDQAFAALGL